MSANINQGTIPCCVSSIKSYRLLAFPDGSQIGVIGLDDIFDNAYKEGKTPETLVAEELVDRLSKNNYIASNQFLHYEAVVLKEYRKFFEEKERKNNE
jgi:hypothetical protein